MANRFKAGTVSDYAGSMAEAMEKALAVEYQRVHGRPLPAHGGEERRLMFAAIAQGILRHLKDNASDALSVAVDVTQDGGSHPVRSQNPAAIPVRDLGNGRLEIDAGVAKVRQQSGRIHSAGQGRVQVLTEGELH